MKKIISVEYVNFLKSELRKINNNDLKNITWTENGKKLKIKKKIIDQFRFTGLNCSDFIDTEFYKSGGLR